MRNKIHTAMKLCKDCETKPVRAGGYCKACYYRHRYQENPAVRARTILARRKWKKNNPINVQISQHRWYLKNRERLLEKIAGVEAQRDAMFRDFIKELRSGPGLKL